MEVYLYFVALAAVWAGGYLVSWLFFRERLRRGGGFRLYPFLVILRSEKLVEVFDRIAGWRPLLWRVLGNMGLAVGFGLMAFAVFFLARNLGVYLFAPQQAGVQNIVIPLIIGVTIRLEHLPYMLLALGVVLITHEGMHGLIARLEKIKLKSTGIFLAFIFPGGFVEPDEEEFKKAPVGARARVAAAGSFANIVVGVLVVLLMIGLFAPLESGVIVLEREEGEGPGVGEVILSVNDTPVNRFTLSQNITAQDELIVRTSGKTYTLKLSKPVNVPLAWIIRSMGVTRIDYYYPMKMGGLSPQQTYTVYRTLWWTQLIAVGVAIFNMLPIHLLDGHLLITSLLEARIRDQRKLKALASTISAACIALLASNIIYTYRTFGFFQI